MSRRAIGWGVAIVIVAAACAAVVLLTPRQGRKVEPNLDPWVLISRDPANPYGTYLANGLISTRVMGEGVGSHNGKPLPCFMAGVYSSEKLAVIPTWSDLRFYDRTREFKLNKAKDYQQILDMKAGILTTHGTWKCGGKSLEGKIEVVVSRAQPNIGLVRAVLTPDFDGRVRFHSPIPSRSDSFQKIKSVVIKPAWNCQPLQISLYRITGSRLSLAIALAQCQAAVAVKRGRQFTSTSLAGVGVDVDQSAAVRSALAGLLTAAADQERFISRHKEAWAKLWEHDIIIDGPPKDQQAIHSCMFYLLQSVREGSRWSIPPMGLSSDAFGGHVFWDADTWMFPALILQHPELARAIVDYRFFTLPGALANARAEGFAGAQYAWESGLTGIEDTPKGLIYRHGRHINGDVALAQWQYYLATGDLQWLKSRGYPVLKATADYWVSRVEFVPTRNRYEIRRVVPPDENAQIVNNSAYTNAGARLNLEIAVRAARLVGARANPKWQEVAAKLYIPFDQRKQLFIPFDGYKGWRAKQADTELLIYPMQFKFNRDSMTDIYRNTFACYAPRVMPNGPAMTSSAHAVIAARVGNWRKAYAEFVKSYKPYLRGPLNYFNEKRSMTYDNMCFLTGAAGPIQAAIFGLAGVRIDYSEPGQSLGISFEPCLPKQWKSLNITGVQWRGKTLDLTISTGNIVRIAGDGFPSP